MSESFSVSITGNSNEANLILGSTTSNINDSTSPPSAASSDNVVDISFLDVSLNERVTSLEAGITSIEADVTLLEAAPRTIFEPSGVKQTWPLTGGGYDNVNHLPDSTGNWASSSATMECFHAEKIEPSAAGYYKGVCDDQHYYSMVYSSTNQNPNPIEGVFGIRTGTRILKFDRFTGKKVAEKDVHFPTSAYDKDGNIVDLSASGYIQKWAALGILEFATRGPISLTDNGVILNGFNANLVLKFRKSDLSLQWAWLGPNWDVVSSGGSYQINGTLPVEKDGVKLIIAQCGAGASYGVPGDDTAYTVILRHHGLHRGKAYIFGIRDLDNSGARLEWDFLPTPDDISAGVAPPDECFAGTDTEMWVMDVFRSDTVITDGSAVTGEPKTSGTILIPCVFGNETYQPIMNNPPQLVDASGEQLPIDFSMGTLGKTLLYAGEITLTAGALDSSYTVTNVTSVVDGSALGVDLTISKESLVGMPLFKKLYKVTDPSTYTHVLTQDEAWAVNYYGGAFYNTSSYDPDTGTFYAVSSNGYSVPMQDSITMMRANITSFDLSGDGSSVTIPLDQNRIKFGAALGLPAGNANPEFFRRLPMDRTGDILTWRDDIMYQYSSIMQEAVTDWNAGLGMSYVTAAPYSTQAVATACYAKSKRAIALFKANEQAQAAARSSLSPRGQRAFFDSAVALDVLTGQLKWADCQSGGDQRDNAVFFFSEFATTTAVLYHESGMNNDGRDIAISRGASGKKIVTTHKSQITVYDPSGIDPSFTVVGTGITNMVAPTATLHMLPESGLGAFGSLVIAGECAYYMTTHLSAINGYPADKFMLPQLPVEGNPVVMEIPRTTNVLWAVNFAPDANGDTDFKWIRKVNGDERFDEQVASAGGNVLGSMNGGTSGYGGMLFLPNFYGTMEMVQLSTGRKLRDMPLTSINAIGMPVVDGVGFFLGGNTKFGNTKSLATMMEMFSPRGK